MSIFIDTGAQNISRFRDNAGYIHNYIYQEGGLYRGTRPLRAAIAGKYKQGPDGGLTLSVLKHTAFFKPFRTRAAWPALPENSLLMEIIESRQGLTDFLRISYKTTTETTVSGT